jgi:hypothetical protein
MGATKSHKNNQVFSHFLFNDSSANLKCADEAVKRQNTSQTRASPSKRPSRLKFFCAVDKKLFSLDIACQVARRECFHHPPRQQNLKKKKEKVLVCESISTNAVFV